jgi:hypothetical protein
VKMYNFCHGFTDTISVSGFQGGTGKVETQDFASLLSRIKGVLKLPGKTQPPESPFLKGGLPD